jgi:glycosyltransferase involved in cell wall biosynthesis
MRIAIFTNNYLPNPYGVTRSIETFRCELEKRGHTVFIFAPYFRGYREEKRNVGKVFRYPSIELPLKIRYPLGIPYSRKMDKIIEKLDLDIIHAQHPNLLGSSALKWAKRKKIPLVFTWHTLYDQYVHFVPLIPQEISVKYIVGKAVKFANKACAVIVPTDSVVPIIKKWGVISENIIPIATGVAEEEFSNPDKNKIREKYKIKKDDRVLLLVARLTIEKNVEFVFRSVKNILKNKNNKLLVAGDGYLRRDLEEFCRKEKISEQVIFCGEVEREEIKNYYVSSDIFVYASKSETQGMIITEAMYAGLPIVAVSATGINSLVLNRGNGFLVSEKEVEFEEAVWKLIKDKDVRDKFSEVSARLAREKFTASVCGEKLLKVYQEAIKNKNCHSERA